VGAGSPLPRSLLIGEALAGGTTRAAAAKAHVAYSRAAPSQRFPGAGLATPDAWRQSADFASCTFRGRGLGNFSGVESRLAKNEALFRQVNERVAEVTKALASGLSRPTTLDGLVCECADPLCSERVGPLTISAYEAVRPP
jgi:hypothetical protein